MGKSKTLQGQQQSMIDKSEESRTAKNGFIAAGNSGLLEGINKSKGKK